MKLNEIFSQKITEDIMLGWESPVNIVEKEWETKIEGDIVKAIKSYDINVDKEELIKALNYDRNQYKAGYRAALKEISGYIDRWIDNDITPWEHEKRAQLDTINDYINYKLNKLIEQEGKK